MPNIIKPKRKYTTGAPIASQLAQGELAINLFDKKIYSKDLSNNIVLIGSLNGSSAEKFKVANAVASDDAINKGQLDTALSNITITGSIIAYPSQIVPSGYLKCDGSLLSRITFASLFAIIGTTYGVGDGSTTFNIPDLRGEFIRGWDNGRDVDSGRNIGSWQGDQFKSHSHNFADAAGGSGGPFLAASAVNWTAGLNDNTSSTGGNETRPRNIAMMYCIKY